MASRRKTETSEISETDLYNRRMGRNSLQGNDQESVHNERQAMPDEKKETDSVLESFRKLDKKYRAKKDLGEGRKDDRSKDDHRK